jgi:hypothetical protein
MRYPLPHPPRPRRIDPAPPGASFCSTVARQHSLVVHPSIPSGTTFPVRQRVPHFRENPQCKIPLSLLARSVLAATAQVFRPCGDG